ncbi:MAG TPA: glycosyltransferase family 2 protein [Candidatus Saccharimonadales bacterium]|nr:glycosyltransferase family 2 protein [Candidatus Saccharimonadales bacterium]
MSEVAVVIPNWNGMESLGDCLDSLLAQSLPAAIIVVENGSKDSSLKFLQANYPAVIVLQQPKNLGFAGGVNVGVRYALEKGSPFIALFNNDAVADRRWLEYLVDSLKKHPKHGIATCKFMDINESSLDSTGDQYTSWGLPFPRGRGEPVSDHYDQHVEVFAASGGASLYRVKMLQEVGLFDEDFFAYYEDVDLSFRAQLAGWKVRYVPEALAYHQIGATSSKIKGFTTYQTMKNLPLLLWKNAPGNVFWRILPRFIVAYYSFMFSAAWRAQTWPAVRGYFRMLSLLPKKSWQRWRIQHNRTVTSAYIWGIITPGLPPNAHKLKLLFHPIKTMRIKK